MKKHLILFVLATAGLAYGFMPPQNKPAAAAPTEGLEVGNLAPDINLNDTAGKPLSLKSLRGRVVLIDFWASWCGPCRMENPNVVKAFNEFKGKNFAILGVSLDKDKESWKKAIA